jgi:N utilization substance protein A
MAILEDVFRNALKKNTVQTIIWYHINPDKGDMEIWRRRIIVADEDLDFENERDHFNRS